MKQTIRFFSILLIGVILMPMLFGCGRQKYKVIFDGYGFESKKAAYAAGDKATVYYGMVATDTDYKFWADDDVKLSQDFDNDHGYVFTFTMPDHDVTLHVESHNSMLAVEREPVRVTFVNETQTADVWILPQTEENLKSSLWGTATVGKLGTGEQREVELSGTEDGGTYIVRIIDDEDAYYAVNDVSLGDGYSIRFTTADSKFDAVLEICDADGNVMNTQPAFTGVLGAE